MRTTVELDRDLLEGAKAAMDASTYQETIVRALEAAVADVERRRLLNRIQGSDLTWALDDLTAYRRAADGHGS